MNRITAFNVKQWNRQSLTDLWWLCSHYYLPRNSPRFNTYHPLLKASLRLPSWADSLYMSYLHTLIQPTTLLVLPQFWAKHLTDYKKTFSIKCTYLFKLCTPTQYDFVCSTLKLGLGITLHGKDLCGNKWHLSTNDT